MTLSMPSSLTLSESRFRRIVEMAPIGMTITALDGCILFVNQAFCAMLGYTKSELEKLRFQDLTHSDDLTANLAQRQMLLSGEIQSYQLEKRYLRKDGQVMWGLLTSFIERDSTGVPTDFVAQVENITERKRATALLQASEERLRLTFDVTSDGLWDLDLRSGIAYLSPRYYAMTGYCPEEVTPDFEFFKRTVHPDDLPHMLEIMEAHMKGKTQSSEIEYRMVTPSGEIKWILGRGRIVAWDAAGAPLRMLGTIKNITDRKNIERKLRESQQLLDGIIEHIPVMVFVKRASDLTFELFNRAGENLLGYSRNYLLGKSDYDLRPKEQGDWFTAADRKVLASQEVTHIPEEPIQTASGETRYLQTWKISLRDENDEPAYLLGISLDVTEHKKEEETHTRLMEHLDASPDFVGFADAANTHIIYINPAGRVMTGIGGEEDVTTLKIADIHPAWANKMLAEVAMPAAAHAGFWKGECAFQHRDGHEIRVSMVLVAHKSADGTLSAFSTISRDITERKQMEQDLSESLHLMELKEHSKTRFLAAAGHDMRQPVAAANLLVETLKSTSLTPFQSKLVMRLDQAMNIFSSMLERLLDISKFDAGLVKTKITAFNLEDLLMWLDQNFAKTAADKQLSFRLFFPTSKPIVVYTDIVLVQSVLMNLVTNALKYTERGGILVSARQRSNKALVQVWDTGIGISEADIPHVFDEFYQVNNPQRNRDSGLGLGLSICQRAMFLLGSEVTCHSQLGYGSVFQFQLPINDQAHGIERQPNNNTQTDDVANKMVLIGKSIVVVEDDVLVAEAMIDLLESLGGKAICFHSAEDALGGANIEYADYYIVDFMLGGKHNGIQLLNMLRQKFVKPIKAVLMTGDTSTDFIRKAELFDWPVVHKPVNISILISKLCLQA